MAVSGRLLVKNIFHSFLAKGVSVACLFLTIPLSLRYVSKAEYGVWLTIYAILAWFAMFDFGLANGLKNKFAAASSANRTDVAAGYVSSSYFFLIITSLVIFLAVVLVVLFGDMTNLFKADAAMEPHLRTVLLLVCAIQLIRFCLEPLLTLLITTQRTGIAAWLNAIGSVAGLLTLLLWGQFGNPGLIGLAVSATLPAVLVLLTTSWYFFSHEFKPYRPSLRKVSWTLVKDILGLSIGFFILQVCGLIIFSSDNFIILRLFAPEDVVPYNIAYRYFSVIYIGFSLIMAPYWPAFTTSYLSGDLEWIQSAVKKLLLIWAAVSAVAVVMLVLAPFVYQVWVGNEVTIPWSLNLSMLLFVIVSNWNNIFANFLNAVSKIRLQICSSVVMALLNIPLCVFFAKGLDMGISGIMLASSCCIFIGSVLQPIQYWKLIHHQAKGIWNA